MSNKSHKSSLKQSRSNHSSDVNFRADVGTTTTTSNTESQVAGTEEKEVSGGLSERLEYKFGELDNEGNLE